MAEKKRKVRGSKTQKAASRDDMPDSNKSTNRSEKRKPRGTPSTPVGGGKKGGQKTLVHQWVSRTLTLGVKGLREEFNAMPRGVPNDMIRVFVANGLNGKNRYKDVPCIDSTRVAVAKTQDGNDYIHANYVETPSSEHRFICTQGPLEKTANDFWAMVLQEKSRVILMLCNFIEKNANKCYEYFPQSEGERKTFGNITVTNGKMVSMPLPRSPVKIVIRALQIERGDERHVADHYHWVDWPDRGVPPADMSAIALVDKIRVTTTPIIVHCSAGIGRTGSIVLIEYTLETLLAGKEIRNMNELLINLRKQRAASVQTDLQYLYVHQVLLEYFRQNQFVDATGNIQAYLERFKTDYVRATT